MVSTTANPIHHLIESLETQLDHLGQLFNIPDMHYDDDDHIAPSSQKSIVHQALGLILKNANKKLCIQLTEALEKEGIDALRKYSEEALESMSALTLKEWG
jgi:hypothetical protein